jgi:two-component system cell cycle response regulator
MADLDHFKRVNDADGHSGGDAVLREVGRRILASVRSYDSVGRYGGEEFLIVAPGCPLPDAVQLAERLRKCVGDVPVNTPSGAAAITISMGVADLAVRQKADDMLHSADRALYAAKSGGRNRVESKSDSKIAVPW